MKASTANHLALILSMVIIISKSSTSAFYLSSPSSVHDNLQHQRQIGRSNAVPYWFKFKIESFQLDASVEEDVEDDTSLPTEVAKEIFPSAEFITFELADHRPLGCTIEETLDPDEDYVFVSKVVPGGFAEQAGIQVGDVVVAVTGLFGEMTPVLEAGVDKM